MSKTCAACGKSIGLMASKATIADGSFVCKKCMNAAGITDLNTPLAFDASNIAGFIARRREIISQYHSTKKIVKKVFEVDEPHRLFKVENTDVFEYSNLVSYDLFEDGEEIAKSGLAQAAAGGFLFGAVGAIVGGINGGRKKKNVCNSLQLQINLRNTIYNRTSINFISTETNRKSSLYSDAVKRARECLNMLQVISERNVLDGISASEEARISQQEEFSNTDRNVSAADEILKFKSLLDSGIITQEEFDAKKKQLLGI